MTRNRRVLRNIIKRSAFVFCVVLFVDADFLNMTFLYTYMMNSLVNSKKGPVMVTFYNVHSSAYVQNISQSNSIAIYMITNMVLLNSNILR